MSKLILGFSAGIVCGYIASKKLKTFYKCSKNDTEMPIQKLDYSPYYVSYYDRSKKIPICVEEIVTKKNFKGGANRKGSYFYEDKQIPSRFQSKLSDYKFTYRNLNLNRGHMSAAGNYKYDQNGMNSSFSLGNTFEMYTKFLTGKFDKVRVISGPVFLPCETFQKGKAEVGEIRFQTIGKKRVYVPTHVYKILSGESKGKKKKISCFLMPNKEHHDLTAKMGDFKVSFQELEEKTGLNFKIKDEEHEDLCDFDPYCSELSRKSFDLHFLEKKMEMCDDFASMTYLENHLTRKKHFVKEIPKFSDKLNEKYEESFNESVNYEGNDCQKLGKLLKLNRHLSESELNNDKTKKGEFLVYFKKYLKNCKEKQTRDTIRKFLKNKYRCHNSFLKKDSEIKKELEI